MVLRYPTSERMIYRAAGSARRCPSGCADTLMRPRALYDVNTARARVFLCPRLQGAAAGIGVHNNAPRRRRRRRARGGPVRVVLLDADGPVAHLTGGSGGGYYSGGAGGAAGRSPCGGAA